MVYATNVGRITDVFDSTGMSAKAERYQFSSLFEVPGQSQSKYESNGSEYSRNPGEGSKTKQATERRLKGSLEQETNAPSRTSVNHSFGSCEVHVGVRWRHRNGCIMNLSTMNRRLIWIEQGEDNGSHSRDQELRYHSTNTM